MIKDAFAQATKDIVPPLAVTATPQVAKLFGVALPDWLLYLGIAYALIRLLGVIPRLFGCANCFWKNKTCTLTCKNPIG